jgi:putative ABC transport system permease protein
MRSYYALAWRNLRANRLRTVLSVIAVIVGVSTTIAGNVVAQSTRRGILTSEDMRTIMEGLVSQLDTMMAFVGVVVMFAAGFLIFNAFAMSVTQRKQQIGALRSLGMTRGQVMRLLMVEAWIIAITGTLIGLLVGPVLGRVLIALMRQFGGGIMAFVETDPSTGSLVLALILGLGVTTLAMLAPARRAAHISPLEALRQTQAEGVERASRWATIIGLVLVIGVSLHVMIAPPGEWVQYPQDGMMAAFFALLWLVGLALLLPAIIGLVGRTASRMTRTSGAVGRLIAENLQRGRARVTLTILALAFSLTVITALVGFLDFFINGLFVPTMQPSLDYGGLFVGRLDITAGWESNMKLDLDSVLVSDEELAAIEAAMADEAYVIPNYFVVAPELSFLGDAYFSFMLDARIAREFDAAGFNFIEGDWETAMPIMESGCGVLVTPLVARKNNAGLFDTISVTGPDGPVECTIAGIGGTNVGATIISLAARDYFDVGHPVLVSIVPMSGHTIEQVEANLTALTEDYPYLVVNSFQRMVDTMDIAISFLSLSFDGLLILAILAAALGVVNTMMMSVSERAREIGLLRAVGTTRRQTRNIIMGEAALMGLIGGVLGLFTGLGLIIVIVLTYGSNSFGLDLNLWSAAKSAVLVSLPTGIVGVIAAPMISALAAWVPMRGILREKPIETLALR